MTQKALRWAVLVLGFISTCISATALAWLVWAGMTYQSVLGLELVAAGGIILIVVHYEMKSRAEMRRIIEARLARYCHD